MRGCPRPEPDHPESAIVTCFVADSASTQQLREPITDSETSQEAFSRQAVPAGRLARQRRGPCFVLLSAASTAVGLEKLFDHVRIDGLDQVMLDTRKP